MTEAMINGIDTAALRNFTKNVARDPNEGRVKFEVATHWGGGTQSTTRVSSWEMGGRQLKKDFTVLIDEPPQLLGKDLAPNPQEMLMAAFNACMMVGYVAGCSLRGIALERIEIQTRGVLDLRGFLGLDSAVKPGYDEIEYVVLIRGSGTQAQFREVHEVVMATSPNRWNMANPIQLKSDLRIETE